MSACPKCRGEMEHGQLNGVVHWAPVPAKASLMVRLVSGLKMMRITGYRCKGCGFIELYAN
jgi:predicted nucleic-acid-binding Zn-ribbon protein